MSGAEVWVDPFLEYCRDPHGHWEHPRAADKLVRMMAEASDRQNESEAAFLDRVVDMARAREASERSRYERRLGRLRRRNRPVGARNPVFIVGLGGSGSHWLGQLLDGLPGFARTREVYLPPRLIELGNRMEPGDSSSLLDAVHLVHALALDSDIENEAMVNNGRGAPERYKRWAPWCTVVYLQRDPRDQVMSVTFRKQRFRSTKAPEASDEEYLLSNCEANIARFERMEAYRHLIDIEVRYEDVIDGPQRVLTDIVKAHGSKASFEEIMRATTEAAPRDARTRRVAPPDPELWDRLTRLLAVPLIGLGYATADEIPSEEAG